MFLFVGRDPTNRCFLSNGSVLWRTRLVGCSMLLPRRCLFSISLLIDVPSRWSFDVSWFPPWAAFAHWLHLETTHIHFPHLTKPISLFLLLLRSIHFFDDSMTSFLECHLLLLVQVTNGFLSSRDTTVDHHFRRSRDTDWGGSICVLRISATFSFLSILLKFLDTEHCASECATNVSNFGRDSARISPHPLVDSPSTQMTWATFRRSNNDRSQLETTESGKRATPEKRLSRKLRLFRLWIERNMASNGCHQGLHRSGFDGPALRANLVFAVHRRSRLDGVRSTRRAHHS